MKQLIEFITDHPVEIGGLLTALYEVVALVIPTKKEKSRSLLKKIFTALLWMVDKVDRKKKTLMIAVPIIIGISLAHFHSQAQQWQAFKGIWLNGYANATQAPIPPAGYSAITYFADSLGTYVYDRDSLAWLRIPGAGGGGGTLTGANNGLRVQGTNVYQGGAFIESTNFVLDGFSLYFDGTGGGNITYEIIEDMEIIFDGGSAGFFIGDSGIENIVSLSTTNSQLTVNETSGIVARSSVDNQNPIFLIEENGGADILNIGEFAGSPYLLTTTDSDFFNSASDGGFYTNIISVGIFASGTTIDIPIATGIININSLAAPPATTYAIVIDDSGDLSSQPISGITNTAANTELAKSDGTNLIPSGVFIPSDGNITMGTGLAGSARVVLTDGTAMDVGYSVGTKGAGSINLQQNTSNELIISSLLGRLSHTTELELMTNGNVQYLNTSAVQFGLWEPDGDIVLGGASLAGSARQITATSSAASADLSLNSQGTSGNIFLNSDDTQGNILTNTSGTNGRAMATFVNGISQGRIERVSAAEIAFSSLVDQISINGVGSTTGGDVNLNGGTGSSGSGGSINFTTGTGTTVDGDLTIDVQTGELIFTITRTDCTGAPSGAIANISGVLNICP